MEGDHPRVLVVDDEPLPVWEPGCPAVVVRCFPGVVFRLFPGSVLGLVGSRSGVKTWP
jgi:hypothetical protein